MQDITLFTSGRGAVTTALILEKLKKVGAGDCDVLYIHTDMTFGLPARGVKRGDILQGLLNAFEALCVKTLVFPAFTFSFCNNEPYDVKNSKTPMGALNEFVRKTGRGARSLDPLLSVYVLGDKLNLVDNLGQYSIGKDSNYDRLHNCGQQVRFLFFGADMRECFTYTHYMEAIVGVPYRYDRVFTGTVIDAGGRAFPDQQATLYSTYANCRLNPVPVVHNAMNAKRQLRFEPIGDSQLCCLKESDAYETISELLRTDKMCLTDGTFDESVRDTAYAVTERVVSVR